MQSDNSIEPSASKNEPASTHAKMASGLTYSLPSHLVRQYGADHAAILYGIAKRLKKQCGRIRKSFMPGSKRLKYRAGNEPVISLPIGRRAKCEILSTDCLSNAYPWINSRTFARYIRKAEEAGHIQVLDDPAGTHRYSSTLRQTVRTPHWYMMKSEMIKSVLDGRKLLQFWPEDAIKYGLNTALVKNKVLALFEQRRRDYPDLVTLILTPKSLEQQLGIRASTIRDSLATLVKDEVFWRKAGEPFYRLLNENPLQNKILNKEPARNYQPLEGISPEVEKLALAEMDRDLRYWYTAHTKLPVSGSHALHFSKAAKICYYNQYNPFTFVVNNMGAGEANKHPAFLHGENAEAKYSWRDCNFELSLYAARRHVESFLVNAEWTWQYRKKKNPELTREEYLLDQNNDLPAWVRIICCPASSPIYTELIAFYRGEAQHEVQKIDPLMREALCELEEFNYSLLNYNGTETVAIELAADGWHPSNLFPYYRRYYDAGSYVDRKPKPRKSNWHIGQGRKTIVNGEEFFERLAWVPANL